MSRCLALFVAALLAGCGGGAAFPGELADGDSGGVVVVDRDGLRTLGEADEPVGSVDVRRVFGGGTTPLDQMTVDTRAGVVTTASDGSFVLGPSSVAADVEHGVEVTFAVAVAGDLDADESGEVTGVVHVRQRIVDGRPDNVVAVPARPERCPSFEACPSLDRPDLVPIVSFDAFDAAPGGAGVAPDAVTGGGERVGVELGPDGWRLDDTDGRVLLRFPSLTANLGTGPLDVIAGSSGDGAQPTWQRLWGPDLRYLDRPAGTFVFHDGHDHFHLDAFERYELIDAGGSVVASSEKVSFCLRDSVRVKQPTNPGASTDIGIFGDADSCGDRQQAINPGYGDYYAAHLPDQWIDVTGVPAGSYTVRITVDPLDVLLEADESNNVAEFDVTLGDT